MQTQVTPTDHIFKLMLVPNGATPLPNTRLLVSVCLELNVTHPVFGGAGTTALTPKEVDKWRENVRRLPEVIQLLRNGQAGPTPGPLSFKGLPYTVSFYEADSEPYSHDAAHEFYARLLGFTFDSAAKTSKLQGETANGQADYPPPPEPAKLRAVAVPAGGNALPGNEALRATSTTPADNTLVGKLLNNWGVDPKSSLSTEQVEGIERAHAFRREQHYARHQSILSTYSTRSTLTAQSLDLPSTSKEHFEGIVNHIDLLDSARNKPEYIRKALAYINMQPVLQKLVGTRFDLVVDMPTKEQIDMKLELTHSIFQGLMLNTANYFDTNFSTVFKRLAKLGNNWASVKAPSVKGPTVEYKSYGMMELPKTGPVVKSFEPSNADKNTQQARDSDAGQKFKDTSLDVIESTVPDMNRASDYKGLIKLRDDAKLMQDLVGLNNRVANMHTAGHTLFFTDVKFLELDVPVPATSKLYEEHITSGWVAFVRITKGTETLQDWTSISVITESLDYRFGTDKKEQFSLPMKKREQAFNPAWAIHSHIIDKSNPDAMLGLRTGMAFTWDGTSVTGKNPMNHPEYDHRSPESKIADRIAGLANTMYAHLEQTAVQKHNDALVMVDSFPYRQWETCEKRPDAIIKRGFALRPESDYGARLKFSDTKKYEYVIALQYRNGYSPVTQEILREWSRSGPGLPITTYSTTPALFQRNEFVAAVLVCLDKSIYADANHKKLKDKNQGETTMDLVVRTGRRQNTNKCVRYILPSPVPSFNTFLWYDFVHDTEFLQQRAISGPHLHSWFLRYQCENKKQVDFDKQKRDCAFANKTIKGCAAGCGTFCGGTTQPPLYNANKSLPYLPDPIATGFTLKFFHDAEHTLPADTAIYQEAHCKFGGNYPALKPWKLKLKQCHEGEESSVKTRQSHSTVTVKIPAGMQLYARMLPTYDCGSAHFFPAAFEPENIFEGEGDAGTTKLYWNSLHSNPVFLSFTHAAQLPVVLPQIKSLEVQRFSPGTPDKALTLYVDAVFEHLNLYHNIPMPDTQPTGELALYALWNDYGDNVQHELKSIEEKRRRHEPGAEGFIHIGQVRFDNLKNKEQGYEAGLRDLNYGPQCGFNRRAALVFEPEDSFKVSHLTQAVFKLADTSKFSRFFTPYDITGDADPALKADFTNWSKEFWLPLGTSNSISYAPLLDYPGFWSARANYLFNHNSPISPVIRKVVPLKVTDTQTHKIVTRGNRLRVYFEPSGMSLPGFETRIGFIATHENAQYRKYLENNQPTAGRDSVTDPNVLTLSLQNDRLTEINFNIAGTDLEPQYMKRFKPYFTMSNFSNDPAQPALIAMLPQYDPEQNLWFTDLELNLRTINGTELHNPFVQLHLVSYQPLSANYNLAYKNTDDEVGYKADLRLSAPVQTEFFCIYPSRSLHNPLLLFNNRLGYNFTLTGHTDSLFIEETIEYKRLATQFIIAVQRRYKEDGTEYEDLWVNVASDCKYPDGNAEQYGSSNAFNAGHETSYKREYHTMLPYDIIKLRSSSHFEASILLVYEHEADVEYRTVLFEIEFFNKLVSGSGNTDNSILDIYLQNNPELTDIDGLRIKDITIISRPEIISI